MRINIMLFQMINQFAGKNHYVDQIVIFLTQQAPVICLLLWLGALLYTIKRHLVVKRNLLIISAIATIVALMINYGIGILYSVPRPFVSSQITHVTTLINHQVDASFPSKHTTGSWTLALTSRGISKKLTIGLFSLAILIGISRIYVGVHWPSDICGGILLAVFVASVTRLVSGWLKLDQPK